MSALIQNLDDGFEHSPSEIFNYLRSLMYQRRNKMNPLWNNLLVAGFKDGKGFLGSVDLIGTAYEDDFLATGFGSYLAIPIMRKKWRPDMEEGEARELLEECLRVLFYRDCRALNKIRIAKATAEGCVVSKLTASFLLLLLYKKAVIGNFLTASLHRRFSFFVLIYSCMYRMRALFSVGALEACLERVP
jgi:20S proteasome alpha/beta subunit